MLRFLSRRSAWPRVRPPALGLYLVAASSLGLVPSVVAQGLPPWAPINPAAATRTGLRFEPYRDPAPDRWQLSLGVDYASAIEYNLPAPSPSWLFDAELLRINVGVSRDLGARAFALAELPVLGTYDGFLDGFLEWYHNLFGIEMPERDARPRNAFAYELAAPGGAAVVRDRSGFFLGDLRLGVGYRWNPLLQTVGSVTLPTSIGPDGYGHGTVSVNAVTTLRAPFASRLVYEGSVGLG